MLNKAKKMVIKVMALCLAVLMTIGTALPGALVSTFAATINSYAIRLTDGEDVIALNDVEVTITDITNPENIQTANTVDGIATFVDFIEEDVTYNVTLAEIEGYEIVESFEITPASDGETYYDVVLEAFETVVISGMVTDENDIPCEGVLVSLTGDLVRDTATDESGEFSFEVYAGKDYIVTITHEDEKYESQSIEVTNLESDYECLPIKLAVKSFLVNTITDINGTISETETVEYGSNKAISAIANEGYRIGSFLVDGVEIEEARGEKSYTYELVNVITEHTVEVTYIRQTYKLTFTIYENGKVSYGDEEILGGSVSVETIFDESTDPNVPTKVEVAAIPNENYRVSKVVVDNEQPILFNENNQLYSTTFEMTQDHTFEVEFSINEYVVTIAAGENGTVSFEGENEETDSIIIAHNEEKVITINILPKSELYKLEAISITKGSDTIGTVVDVENDVDLVKNEDGSYSYQFKGVVDYMNIDVSFKELETLEGDWSDYVSIIPVTGTLNSNYTDENGNKVYVYSNDAELKLSALTPYTYINYSVEGTTVYEGWKTEHIISNSCIITDLQVQENAKGKGAAHVGLNNHTIHIIIDKDVPTVKVDTNEFDWTKTSAVTITGKASDAVENPASGVSHVVWSKDVGLSTEAVLAETEHIVEVDAEGIYSFKSVAGEQKATYYIYAVDIAGNVSEAVTSIVKIDTTNPTVDSFEFSIQKNTVIQDIIKFLSFGTICKEKMYLVVKASDANISSELKEVTLYYYGDNEKVLKTEKVVGGSAVFELTEEVFNDGKEISAVVWDNAGNSSEKTKPTDVGAVTDIVKINSAKPTATIAADNEVYKDVETGNLWYNGNVAFVIDVTDENTGINSVAITLNEKEITEEVDGSAILSDYSATLVKDEQFKVNTSQNTADGENVLAVTVTNNALVESDVYTQNVYIDTTKPDITSFEITRGGNQLLDKIFNFLTFGTFFNEKVEITVTAEDLNASSGINSITLYADGEPLETKTAVDNKCTFTVPIEEITNEAVYFDKVLSAKATDNVNNTTATAVEPTTVNSNIKDSGLMIETVKPTINVSYKEPVSDKNANTADENDWYNSDIEFKVIAKDADAGLRNVIITINDTELVNANLYEAEEPVHESEAYVVNTSQATIEEDGSYTIKVQVVDNAGNVGDVYTKTVYKDIHTPYIYGFDFDAVNYVEGAKDAVTVEATNYGFYFKADTKVTITAKDDTPSTGLKTITYYTVDIDAGKSEEVTAVVNNEGKIEFVLEANFKGQIYAKATDNVGNVTESYVTPNSAIVEDEDRHKEETHILLDRKDTSDRTSEGGLLYNSDVPVTITVIDTYSGIREIAWSVEGPNDPANNQSGSVIVNNDRTLEGEQDWTLEKTEANLVTEMKKTINVTNNSNNITVYVKMIDRAGNASEEQIGFSIDKTNPSIEVVFDNNSPDSDYRDIYKADRTATITITERNFNASNVSYNITNTDGSTPMISGWSEHIDTANPDASYAVATVVFVDDGDYTFDIGFTDLARNPANTVDTSIFTIDKTIPTVSVAYNLGSSDATNGNYFKENRIATITIVEHNFDSSRVGIVGEVLETKEGATFPIESNWASSGDVHTATITYSANAKYAFDINFTDKAGNEIVDYTREEFYVDKDKPMITFDGVKKASNGEVIPIIECTDTNYDKDKFTIELVGVNLGKIDVTTSKNSSYPYARSNITDGEKIVFEDFKYDKLVDDIYILTATATDKADNTDTQQIIFSVNRYGSVYDLSKLSNINGKYNQQPEDIVFTETNVNAIDTDKVKVRLTKNGVPTDLVKDKDFTIVKTSGSDEEWYVYTYTIKKDVFADDGRYSVAVYSVDDAENVNENIVESKQAEISFGIDNTAPVISILQFVESNEIYSDEKKEIALAIKDNMVLDTVKITLNGEIIEPNVDNEVYSFTVVESNERQNITIYAKDLAGKEVELIAENFLISSNFFVRWYNNKPLFIGSIVGGIGAGVGLAGAIVFGKKKTKAK